MFGGSEHRFLVYLVSPNPCQQPPTSHQPPITVFLSVRLWVAFSCSSCGPFPYQRVPRCSVRFQPSENSVGRSNPTCHRHYCGTETPPQVPAHRRPFGWLPVVQESVNYKHAPQKIKHYLSLPDSLRNGRCRSAFGAVGIADGQPVGRDLGPFLYQETVRFEPFANAGSVPLNDLL